MVKNAWAAPWRLRFHVPVDKGVVVALGAAVAVVLVAQVAAAGAVLEAVIVVGARVVSEIAGQEDPDATMKEDQGAVLIVVTISAAQGAQVDSEVETVLDPEAEAEAIAADPRKDKVVQDASKSLPHTHIHAHR